jgi:holo-[acyl-carrier protein] synthase
MSGAEALNGPVAVGVDIVDIARLRRMVERWGEVVLDRLFTATERDGLRGARGVRWDSLAGHYAAKEAVRKVFGSRGRMPRWTDIQVEAGEHGQPVLTLLGEAHQLAACCGFQHLVLSISHEKSAAVAVVLAM